MKKRFVKIVSLILIALLFSFFIYLFKKEKPKQKEPESELEETSTMKIEGIRYGNCERSKSFYLEQGEIRYYLSCLTEVKLTINKEEYTLKKALEDNLIKIDDLLEKMSMSESDSFLLYKAEDEESISNLSILKCNTVKGNHDYYIGDSSMKYEEGFCERNCTFTRTFHILSVEQNIDSNYYDVTLMQYQGEEIETVKVKKELNQKYQMNAAYEFTFTKDELDYMTDDSIRNLFDTFIVNNVSKTEKTGLDQTQEKICQIK